MKALGHPQDGRVWPRKVATSSRSRRAIRRPIRSRGTTFSDIAARAPAAAGTDRVLQYGPTRGYRPLRRGDRRDHARAAASPTAPDRARSSRPDRSRALDLVARVLLDPGDVDPRRAADLHRRHRRVPQRAGARWSASSRRRTASISTRSTRPACGFAREGRRVRLLYVVPNFQNPTGLLIGLGQARRAARVGGAARRAASSKTIRTAICTSRTRRRRPTSRPIKADDATGRVDLPEQLLEDARARVPRGVDRRAAPPLAAKFEMAKQAGGPAAPARSISASCYEACRRGVLARQLPMLRAHYQHKRDVMVAGAHARARRT